MGTGARVSVTGLPKVLFAFWSLRAGLRDERTDSRRQEGFMKITDTIGSLLKSRPRNRILSIAPEQTVLKARGDDAPRYRPRFAVPMTSWWASSPSATMPAKVC